MRIRIPTNPNENRLTVLSRFRAASNKKGHTRIRCVCLCDCGNKIEVWEYSLKDNHTRSCGCLVVEQITKASTTHGLSRHKLYGTYHDMRRRCYNPKDTHYYCYGAKGIRVCRQWMKSFEKFYEWAMAAGWAEGLTVDRKNNDKNYSPSNCRIATQSAQQRNKTTNVTVTAFGESKIMIEWSEDPRCQVVYKTFCRRINAGWNAEEAITTPVQKNQWGRYEHTTK